ncbi:hypothetical protein ABFV99_23890 [Cytobacillus horneckiae]|uniref:hypothetical protein n=1 Tax=Cytobacillus horneckiae TaxID=549687 RepID=UPI0034CF93E0
MTENVREKLIILEKVRVENVMKAQEIVLMHLEKAIKQGDSATVAAMAEILKI